MLLPPPSVALRIANQEIEENLAAVRRQQLVRTVRAESDGARYVVAPRWTRIPARSSLHSLAATIRAALGGTPAPAR
jgi:hypothetical protein